MHSPLPVLGRGEPERYESPAQVASDLNVSLLGALARSEGEWTPPLMLPDLIDPEAPYDAVADRIALLAGQMPLKLLGCIGLGDDPLRYRLAANLAARLARTGARVTLVEAELHAPLLQADKNQREGLVDMLLYGCSFAAVARESGIPGVRVVGAGSHLWSGEPIHGDEWERVLAALRAGSDYTIVTTTTGLPAPILGMLIRRLDSIVIAYALERASREAIRRSYLALWDMDAPILGLITEGPHLAGAARPAAAERGSAPPPARKVPAAPPQIAADWASRLLGAELAPGVSPMTEEVEVVIRQTSEVDAAAAALWEKEVERLRSILTAPDGVQPFLDTEAPPPVESEAADFDSAWALDDPPSRRAITAEPADAGMAESIDELAGEAEPESFAAPAVERERFTEPQPFAEPEPFAESEPVAEPEPFAEREPVAESEPFAGPEPVDEPAAAPPAPQPPQVPDWGAAIGAEIAAWGTAVPDESRPSSAKIPGLERITIVAEDTFFAAARAAAENPPGQDQEASAGPLTEPPAPPPPAVPPAVPSLSEALPPAPPSPRSEVALAAEEAASWFARIADGAGPATPPDLPATPPAPPIAAAPPVVPPLDLGPPPIEVSSDLELGARLEFETPAPEPIQPFVLERTPAPELPAPVFEPLALAEPEPAEMPAAPIAPDEPVASVPPVEPAPVEATFPWHQPETAAEDEDEVAFWPSAARTTDPLPSAVSPDDLTIIQDIEQELVGAAAASAAAAAPPVVDEPPPSRTPWRVMVIGCLVGLAAVGLWAYQSGMIRLEPPPPRRPSAAVSKESPAAARKAGRAGTETHAPASNSAPVPPPASESSPAGADGGSAPGSGATATPPATATALPAMKGSASTDKAPITSGMGLDTALGSQAIPPSGKATAAPAVDKRASQAATSTKGNDAAALDQAKAVVKPAAPPTASAAKPAPTPTTPAPSASQPATDVRLVGEAPAGYGVHVSSFKTQSIAQNDLARFRALGYPGVIVTVEVPGRGIWQRVVLGPYDSPSEADAMATAVRAAGLSEKAQAMRLKP